MNNTSFTEDGVQFAWDATSITSFETCPQKYEYEMIYNWTRGNKNFNLRFGGHFATALEHHAKRVALGESWTEALENVVLEVMQDTWDREPGEEGKAWESGDQIKDRESLVRSIIWYFLHFEEEPIPTLIMSDGKPAVEYSFSLHVDNGIVFAGHLDRVGIYGGHNWVLDNKTTKSTISNYYFDGFKPDIQMSMYSFAGKAVFNVPIQGVIIDAAQIAVGFTRFARGFTTRSEGELNEWYDTTMELILSAQEATREHHFPMRRTSCGNYGGCAFRGVCSKPKDLRPNFLAADFVKREPWDPLKRR